MNKTKFKMPASLAAQFTEGTEYPAIIADGQIFLPVMPAPAGTATPERDAAPSRSRGEDAGEERETSSRRSEPAPAREEKSSGGAKLEKYTEKELMDMDAKDIIKMLEKADLDHHIPAEGKNTNAKIRTAYLAAYDAQNGKGGVKEESRSRRGAAEPEAEEKTSRRGAAKEEAPKRGGSSEKAVAKIMDNLEANEIDEEEAVASLLKIGGNKKDIENAVAEALDDARTPMSVFIKKITDLIDNEEEAAPAEEKSSRRGGEKAPAKKSEPRTIKAAQFKDELEVGMEVEVYWEKEDTLYKGVVESIDRKGIFIKYEDGTAGYIDKNNTEIDIL